MEPMISYTDDLTLTSDALTLRSTDVSALVASLDDRDTCLKHDTYTGSSVIGLAVATVG